jgi:effector-binding domain-containing protein
MKFYVGSADSAKDLTAQGAVKVVNMPERTVVSIGIRGSYTKKSFEENRSKILAWLQENPGYTSTGEAYAVYWDAPFVPEDKKHSEVHVPVIEQRK